MNIDVYPRMAPDSADYLRSDIYKVRMEQRDQKLEVIHCLEDANTLPAQWLRDGYAHLCCEVRVPSMLYSDRYRSNYSQVKNPDQGPLEFHQLLDVPLASEKRMYFLPTIVLSEAREEELNSAHHGVSALWDRQYVCFPKGAILAGGIVFNDPNTTLYPLDFVRDDTLQAGTISASPNQEDESWKYVVKVPNDLLLALRDPQNRIWLQSVYIGCLAQMLIAVQRDFSDPEIPRPPAVEELGKMIRNLSMHAPPWETEESEWDDTLRLATLLMKETGGLIAPQPGENES